MGYQLSLIFVLSLLIFWNISVLSVFSDKPVIRHYPPRLDLPTQTGSTHPDWIYPPRLDLPTQTGSTHPDWIYPPRLDLPTQTGSTHPDWIYPPRLDLPTQTGSFCLEETFLKQQISYQQKVLSQINLCRLSRLILDNTFNTCFMTFQCGNQILKAFANSLDPDETPQNVASHQDPNCLLF
ncbi:hypothetical protein DPMN_060712 [Dreissena polymorpha]|uniref:Uncharacterized protein n=1 Tax=Dreissena polymorpha TaxID=45954 RepID=A0A9D4C6E0_DREPO|nr:hypothetical protein DPMN_060712 [Dreissena polymorpha]